MQRPQSFAHKKMQTHFVEEQELFSTTSPTLCDPATSFNCLVSSGRFEKQMTYLADIPPDTASCQRHSETWDRNDSILSRYWSPEDGIARRIFENDNRNGNHLDSHSRHLTYGEVTPLGVRQLAFEMGISDCEDRDYQTSRANDDSENVENEIVFYDLGSGVGRLVTQMYIDQPDRMAKAVGIELAEDRHRIGAIALEGIIAEEQYITENFYSPYTDDNAIINKSAMIATKSLPIQLIQGDVLEVDFDQTTTHVFISSLCFPENTLLALQKKLLRLSNIRVIATLNRLDLIHQLGEEQWEERNVFIQMSWGASMAKIYRKTI